MERAQLSLTAQGRARPALTAAREQAHYSLEEVGERLGVSKSTVHRWEKKGDIPQPLHIRELCKLFGASARELGFDEPSAVDVQTVMAEQDEDEHMLTAFRQQNLISRLMRILWNWPRSDARYQVLQQLIMVELEDNSMNDEISRRDALRFLALVPADMLGLSQFQAIFKKGFTHEDILKHCAAGIIACWDLRKGKELAFADLAVSKYIPTLKAIAQTAPDVQRKSAADLLAQCFLLKSTLSRHVDTSNDAIFYAQQAEIYGEQAENLLLSILALRTQAAAHYYANRWQSALQAAEKAKFLLEESGKRDKQKQSSISTYPTQEPIPQLVHSYIYAGIATYQARNGYRYKDDALLSLKKAHKTFSNEQAPIWIDHNPANLILNDGMTHYHLGLYKEALDSFAQTKSIQQDEVGRVEILIDEVMTEISRDDKPRDMQWCIDHWALCVQKAKMMQSQQHINEAIQAYATMCAVWPAEKQVKNLREHIVHW